MAVRSRSMRQRWSRGPIVRHWLRRVLETLGDAGLIEAPLRIIDIGTGTGCLLISLLAELPSATRGWQRSGGAGAGRGAGECGAARGREPGGVRGGGRVGGVGGAVRHSHFEPALHQRVLTSQHSMPQCDAMIRSWRLMAGRMGLMFIGRSPDRRAAWCRTGWVFLEIGMGMRADVCGVFDAGRSDRPLTGGCGRISTVLIDVCPERLIQLRSTNNAWKSDSRRASIDEIERLRQDLTNLGARDRCL